MSSTSIVMAVGVPFGIDWTTVCRSTAIGLLSRNSSGSRTPSLKSDDDDKAAPPMVTGTGTAATGPPQNGMTSVGESHVDQFHRHHGPASSVFTPMTGDVD